MSKIVVIGSTVCDVFVYVDRLPSREGDTHIRRQEMRLGGCAFNVAHFLHQTGLPYRFVSPVGRGLYGDFVRQGLSQLGMTSTIDLSGTNGCCYCFIEEDGERTFLSEHGVEYSFDASWLEGIEIDSTDFIYVCGLEVEEVTGDELVEALAHLEGQIVFCPGPRGSQIPRERLDKLLALSPILHLNEMECLALAQTEEVEEGVLRLSSTTQNLVVVTKGGEGVIAYDGSWYDLPAYASQVVDTVGAGDSHVAGLLAALHVGFELDQALDFANLVASHVVASTGVHLERNLYHTYKKRLKDGK